MIIVSNNIMKALTMNSASDTFNATKPVNVLPTKDKYITDPEGNTCPVLNTDNIDFTDAVSGRKKATTLVRCAEDGEGLGQSFEGGQETFEYVTKKGDAIFVNSPTDQYVPPSKDGGRLQFSDLEENGFQIVSGDSNEVQVKSPPAQLLVAVVTERVCIMNAWGAENKPENHQFLSAGATLKQGDDGKITGIDKEGFEKWELDEKSSHNQDTSYRADEPSL